MADTILSQLQSAAKGLLYPSEQDHPIKAAVWSKADVGTGALDAAVKKLAKAPTSAPVETQPLDEFFAPITTPQSWHSEDEKKAVQQAQQLAAIVKQQLSDVKVFRIGDTKKQVVVVGKTPEGDFAGVTTQVVET
jgi:hypothetical protein